MSSAARRARRPPSRWGAGGGSRAQPRGGGGGQGGVEGRRPRRRRRCDRPPYLTERARARTSNSSGVRLCIRPLSTNASRAQAQARRVEHHGEVKARNSAAQEAAKRSQDMWRSALSDKVEMAKQRPVGGGRRRARGACVCASFCVCVCVCAVHSTDTQHSTAQHSTAESVRWRGRGRRREGRCHGGRGRARRMPWVRADVGLRKRA